MFELAKEGHPGALYSYASEMFNELLHVEIQNKKVKKKSVEVLTEYLKAAAA